MRGKSTTVFPNVIALYDNAVMPLLGHLEDFKPRVLDWLKLKIIDFIMLSY